MQRGIKSTLRLLINNLQNGDGISSFLKDFLMSSLASLRAPIKKAIEGFLSPSTRRKTFTKGVKTSKPKKHHSKKIYLLPSPPPLFPSHYSLTLFCSTPRM